MEINQRFNSRKDLAGWVVYFEEEGPLEMPEVSAFVMSMLSCEKSRDELVTEVRANFPELDAEHEVDEVIETLRQLNLLSF